MAARSTCRAAASFQVDTGEPREIADELPCNRAVDLVTVTGGVANGKAIAESNLRCGALYGPTVLGHVKPDTILVREETFGPVLPVIRFETVDEAISIVNGSGFGLFSGVCTSRLDLITRRVDELQVGSVNVGEVPGYRLELTQFGGIKDSGLGYTEGVLEAMKSCINVKTYSLPWPLR